MPSILVVISRSEFSSPLTVLNTILKDVKFNKQTSRFSVNGSHIIVITPSVPIYRTTEEYYNVGSYHYLNA